MKRLRLLYVGFCLMAGAWTAGAQMPSMRVAGERSGAKPDVTLQKMDIEVEIFGNVAVTTMKMVFHNHNARRVLEGELTFPMPDGVSVSRYAIDINGKLRDAVPVAKAKATEVFESIENRRVDPGLLERVEGNNFRTRVYPLPANGERTVLVAYEEALTFKNGNTLQYHLPLNYPAVIQDFSLQVKVYKAAQKPQLAEQPDGSFSFSGNSEVYEASLQRSDYRPYKALTINLPKEMNVPETVVQRHTDGSYYFLINASMQNDTRPKTWSDRIGIIWDNSLSGLSRDHEKELVLLDKIIRQKQHLVIELGLLNTGFKHAGSFVVKDGDWSALKHFLQNLVYDGGTNFGQVDENVLTVDEYLLFSDGLSTFGAQNIRIDKPVYSICSVLKSDFGTLKAVSSRTGGKFINLNHTSVDDAFQQIRSEGLQFLGIAEQATVSEVYPSSPVEVNGHIAVAGKIRASTGEVTLLFGRNGQVESRQRVNLRAENSDIQVGRIWAQMKIAEMDVRYEDNKEAIELLGRQFGIVTRNTSLLVLEEVSDYVRYDIVPPDELLSEYKRLLQEKQLQKENRVNDLLERAIAMTDDLKAWWNTDFSKKNGKQEYVIEEEMSEYVLEEEEIPFTEQVADSRSQDSDYRMPAEDAKEATDSQSGKSQAGSKASIHLPPIKSDKDYIRQIRSATDPYSEYLTLRETYMGTPGFFFDVSDFFYEIQQAETGFLILSCLAELDIENAELFKTLAYKLNERGRYHDELFITRKIREWRPMDPQSHRDYALSLQKNGQYQEALECLYGILNASYSQEAANRDQGIEEVIVCEINNLISRHKKELDLQAIHPQIIADLPVDIRVVINWNKNHTDIDLWVTDPNGIKCFYHHPRTSSGGRISNDFTQGFGPEQFMLKTAGNGTYKVETNFYGEQQLTLSGPTAIMAEIYLYYSDGRQERQTVTFQSGENGREEEGVLIATFEFSDNRLSSHPLRIPAPVYFLAGVICFGLFLFVYYRKK